MGKETASSPDKSRDSREFSAEFSYEERKRDTFRRNLTLLANSLHLMYEPI